MGAEPVACAHSFRFVPLRPCRTREALEQFRNALGRTVAVGINNQDCHLWLAAAMPV